MSFDFASILRTILYLVNTHSLLGIRQDRITKHINVHLEMIVKTKAVRVKKLSANCTVRASHQLLH